MQKFFSDAAAFVAREKRRRLWIAAVVVLACAVVLGTVFALTRPADALTAPVTYCGKEEHTHTDACYTKELTCGQEESAGHTHSDSCYETQPVLICGQEESEEHTHTDACYTKELTCGQEESTGHTHTDACYSEVLTCGKEEHTHTDACYVDPNGDSTASDADDQESDKTADVNDGEDGDADSASQSDAQDEETLGEGTSQPQKAPAKANGIQTRAADFNTNTTYAIIYFNDSKAMGADLKGVAIDSMESGNPITVTGDAQKIAVWELQYKGTNQYSIHPSGNSKKYLDVSGSGNLRVSDSSKTWTFTEAKSTGSYTLNCIKNNTIIYYLSYDNNNKEFVATTDPYKAVPLFFVAKDNITSGGGGSGEGSGGGSGGGSGDSSSDTVEGLTPSGTVINLFDYSVKQDVSKEMNQPVDPDSGINQGHILKFTTGADLGTKPRFPVGCANVWTGSQGGVLQGIVDNTLDGGYPVLSGDETIFDRDYIHRNAKDTDDLYNKESLSYLFDPNKSVNIGGVNYKASYTNVGGLLQIDDEGYYYYDSTKNYAEFNKTNKQFTLYDDWAVQYTPSGGQTEKGQFFPFAAYKDVNKNITPGDDTYLNYYFGMTLTTRFVQDYGGHTDSTKQKDTTFEFSGDDDVWIFIDDVLVADLGGIHLAADVDINFADGTVTIDKVYKSGTGINNDTVQIDENVEISLAKAFQDAGKTVDEANGWVQNDDKNWIFADDTYHTLKFFYLERGGFASNMMVKYNLKSIPASSIVKVDQYGDKVSDAEFALYAAQKTDAGTYEYKVDGSDDYITLEGQTYTIDEDGIISVGSKTIKPIYYGKTDSDGKMTFVDSDGMPLALSDLQEKGGGTDHFILRETKIPDGYRGVNDEVWMYLDGGILYSDNSYDSGAWAAANALVTATDTIYLNDQKALNNGNVADVIKNAVKDTAIVNDQVKLPYYSLASEQTEVHGTLFAVVLKYKGDTDASSMKDLANWVPVYGNDLQGYHVNTVKDTGDTRTDFVTAVIDTAKKMEEKADYGDSIFDLGSSGSMQVLITQLPGDMKSYYSVLLKKHKDDANPEESIAKELGYTVAYYWTTASSLNDATAANTFRVNAEAFSSDGSSYDGFERTFGASIEVPNLVNRVFVQKIGEKADGEKVAIAGARFALYSVKQEEDGTVYYIADSKNGDDSQTLIHLGPAAQNKGDATVKGSNEEGTYTVNSTSGVITVTVGPNGQEYTITPKSVADTKDNNTDAMADGTAVFTNTDETNETKKFTFTQGTYYIREIFAPDGYQINNTEIQVLVDDNTIYTNAGTATDGVSVGRGPGYVVKPLLKSAAYDDIDNTLTWVYARMKVFESTNFSDASKAATGSYVTSYTGQGFGAKTETQSDSGSSKDPQTVYLAYDAGNGQNKVFNYAVNTEKTSNGEEGNTDQETGTEQTIANDPRLLFTSVGWSDYQIYQDAAYSKGHVKDGAEYVVLTNQDETAKNIANLFSRSTYIQVEDPRISKLKISKTVTLADGVDADKLDRNASFTFTVDLYEANQADANPEGNEETSEENPKLLEGKYPYTVYSADNILQSTGSITKINKTIELKDNQYVVIEELPYNAQYLISETSVPKGYTPSYTIDGGTPGTDGSTEKHSLKWTASDQTTTVAFTNTYSDNPVVLVNLTLEKVDSENQNTKLSGAEFVLYKEVGNDENQYYSVTSDGSASHSWVSIISPKTEKDYALTTGTDGTIKFSELEPGTYYLKEVRAPDGYTLRADKIKVEVANGEIETSNNCTTVSTDAPNFTIQVSNSAGVALPETGGTGTIYLTIGGLLLMAVAAGGYELRRRHRKEVS